MQIPQVYQQQSITTPTFSEKNVSSSAMPAYETNKIEGMGLGHILDLGLAKQEYDAKLAEKKRKENQKIRDAKEKMLDEENEERVLYYSKLEKTNITNILKNKYKGVRATEVPNYSLIADNIIAKRARGEYTNDTFDLGDGIQRNFQFLTSDVVLREGAKLDYQKHWDTLSAGWFDTHTKDGAKEASDAMEEERKMYDDYSVNELSNARTLVEINSNTTSMFLTQAIRVRNLGLKTTPELLQPAKEKVKQGLEKNIVSLVNNGKAEIVLLSRGKDEKGNTIPSLLDTNLKVPLFTENGNQVFDESTGDYVYQDVPLRDFFTKEEYASMTKQLVDSVVLIEGKELASREILGEPYNDYESKMLELVSKGIIKENEVAGYEKKIKEEANKIKENKEVLDIQHYTENNQNQYSKDFENYKIGYDDEEMAQIADPEFAKTFKDINVKENLEMKEYNDFFYALDNKDKKGQKELMKGFDKLSQTKKIDFDNFVANTYQLPQKILDPKALLKSEKFNTMDSSFQRQYLYELNNAITVNKEIQSKNSKLGIDSVQMVKDSYKRLSSPLKGVDKIDFSANELEGAVKKVIASNIDEFKDLTTDPKILADRYGAQVYKNLYSEFSKDTINKVKDLVDRINNTNSQKGLFKHKEKDINYAIGKQSAVGFNDNEEAKMVEMIQSNNIRGAMSFYELRHNNNYKIIRRGK